MTARADAYETALAGLRELIIAAEHFRQAMSATHGLAISDMTALGYLHNLGDMGQTQLAEHLGLTTSSTTTLVDRLASAGHVVRRSHPDDRRRVIVSITPEGHDFVRHTRALFSRALDRVPDEQLADVADALHIIAEDLYAQPRRPAEDHNVRT
jgi:DNA-binding MarR family transcriptional regulator